LIEDTFGFKDELNCVTAGAVAAAIGSDVVRFLLDAITGVGGGDGEADFAHDGQIDDVIADIADFFERYAFLLANFANGTHLERLALIDEFKAEVVGAGGDGFALALGDDAALHAAEAGQRYAESVMGAVAFGFDERFGLDTEADVAMTLGGVGGAFRSRRRVAGNEPEGAVSEDAVYVEEDDFDFAGAVLRGSTHALIVPTELVMIEYASLQNSGDWARRWNLLGIYGGQAFLIKPQLAPAKHGLAFMHEHLVRHIQAQICQEGF